MKNIKLFTILSITSLLILSVSSVYAGNIGRTVYGIFSETYLGVSGDSSSDDWVNFYPDNGAASNSSECIEGNVGIMIVAGSWYTEPFGNTSGKDLSSYSRIYFSVKFPSSGNTAKAYIKIEDTSGNKQLAFNSTSIKCVDSSSTSGVLKDGAWHTYYIDLSNFTNLNLSRIKNPLALAADPGSGTFYVDNVIYAKSGAVYGNASPVLDFTLKNVNGNGAASSNDKFTWGTSVFRNGWKTADQYVDLDVKFKNGSQNVDVLSAQSLNDLKKWSFRIYSSSQTETMQGGSYVYTDQQGLIPYQKNGSNLIVYNNADPNKKLPMCWRMMDTVLSTTSGSAHTTIIGERSDYNLYDLGSSDSNRENWNCWLYVKNIANYTASDKEYYTIWNYKGWHASTDPSNGFFNGWACTPKLYIGAKFTDALAGLEYRNKITIESYYE